ncbi:uncharacterized protein LOC135820736 [Sycon ciliatum]|uniref:uncharacterized protein LOC135820736 n=1 Tax=Sycon ciliatum TaxID=27933 RepID=UPI0031F68F52
MSTAAKVVQNHGATSPCEVVMDVMVNCDSPPSLEAQLPASSEGGVAPALTAQTVGDRLLHWKGIIKQNRHCSYYAVGQALHSILYDEHLLSTSCFHAWTKTEVGLSRSNAYEYIRGYKIARMIRSQDPNMLVPTALSHFRVFNNISLEDNAVKVFQLWKAILESTPPENIHQLTAKEILAKGKSILCNGTSNADTMPKHHLHGDDFEMQESLPSSALSQVASSNKSRQPVWEHERRSVGYSQAQQHDIDCEAHGDVDYNGAYRYTDDDADEQPMFETNSRTTHAGQAKRRNHPSRHRNHPSRHRNHPSRHVMSTSGNNGHGMVNDQQHGQQCERHVNGDIAVRSPDDALPPLPPLPALIPISITPGQLAVRSPDDALPPLPPLPALIPISITPGQLAGIARRLVRPGFDVSVCPAETSDEECVIDAATTHMSHGYSKPWRGTVWGNFSGPRFDDHDELAVYVGAAMDRFNDGEYDSGVFVVNVAFFSSFFPKLLQYPHCFLRKPLEAHLPGDSTNDDAITHHQVIVAYFGSDVSQFVQVMTNHGYIPGVNSWCPF